MSESHDIEQIARDEFDCERDDDDFTVFWERGVRWINIQKSGLITVGESPWREDCPPVKITIAQIRDQVAAISAAEAKGRLDGAKIPEGWALVPTEPTRAMTLQACDHLPCVDGVFGHGGKISANVYRAMIAAAPPPPPTWDWFGKPQVSHGVEDNMTWGEV